MSKGNDDFPKESYEIHIDDRQGLTSGGGSHEYWSKSILVGSLFSTCFCPFLGLMATVWSVLAYIDMKTTNIGGFRSRQRLAKRLMIAAFCIGIILIIIRVVLFVTFELDIIKKVVSDQALVELQQIQQIQQQQQQQLGVPQQ